LGYNKGEKLLGKTLGIPNTAEVINIKPWSTCKISLIEKSQRRQMGPRKGLTWGPKNGEEFSCEAGT